jgi:glutathione S-transferase
VRKVMIAAHELGLESSIETVRSVAVMSSPNPAIMADNPLSKIPTMVLASGEVLYDSLTICEYLDALAGGNILFPAPGPDRWRALTWHSLGNGLIDQLILWRNEREKPLERQTPEWISAFACKTKAALDRLEAFAPELETAPFGIGHIAIGCCLSYIDFRFPGLEWPRSHSGLVRFHRAFTARPSAIATEVVDG